MIGLRPIWGLVLGHWIIRATHSWGLIMCLIWSCLFTTAENTTSLNIRLFVLCRMHSDTRLLASSPSFRNVGGVRASDLGKDTAASAGQLGPVGHWGVRVGSRVGILMHERTFGATCVLRRNVIWCLALSTHWQQNSRSTSYTALSRLRTIVGKRWDSSHLAGGLQLALFVSVGICSENILWYFKSFRS